MGCLCHRLGKERKKADKAVFDSQERAFWRVHRPGVSYILEGSQTWGKWHSEGFTYLG